VVRNVMQHGGEKAAELLHDTPEPVARRVRTFALAEAVWPWHSSHPG